MLSGMRGSGVGSGSSGHVPLSAVHDRPLWGRLEMQRLVT